ncbi:hypothetical protein Pla108_40170 [Botrimarina colliarenosi]|uniref:PEP-CTERM protein-sorting domain-containing protein n=1 Tax=Botrimarina colliarenosi TaxID=2528001 RepID=A0A5C6A0N2_9BACT|nr:PEP-CTERM sorting domain-containing protein [Botrimarina colliarenosi]TWT92877.1 hypothetical protein Pla108_40170 [Botrimarina colliarenosi]
MKACLAALACLGVAATLTPASAYYKTVTIDGDFSDWADVPVIDSDPADNPGSVDIGDIKVANDENFLYIYYTSYDSLALSTFISIDYDSDVSTGYDVFGMGLIGSEAAWQNDFPFQQQAGVFNNGLGLTGEFFGSGAALIAPYGDFPEHELAISLDIAFGFTGIPVFDDADFDLLLWTDVGAGDVSSKISYTLSVPEPTSAAIVLLGALGTATRRRN